MMMGVFLLSGAVFLPQSAKAQPSDIERERQVPPGQDRERGVPPGLERQEKTPAGFDEGRKTGWETQTPPGWQQKSEQERQAWKDRVRDGRENISRSAREQGLDEEEAQSAADAFEKRVRRGMDPEEGESVVRERIRRGDRGRALSETIDEDVEELQRPREEQTEPREERPGRQDRGGDRGRIH